MAIDLGTLYTTIEAQTKGYTEANKETEKLAKSMLRQADAVKKAELEVERLTIQLKDVAGASKYVGQAENALESFRKKSKQAGTSATLFSASQKDFKNSLAHTKNGLLGAGIATTGWQSRMQELTKSIQLALGPLSGVASRITALTALFNRSTLIWAGLFAGITAVSVGMFKAVAAGTLYESSMAKITHQLELTGHASGQTTEDIDRMTKALAINTLASVNGAREAATAILTFTSITGDNVERTLGLAQDLTDSLGGDLLANAKKLGKAIEDPSKAFKTLNEMGARLSETEMARLKTMAATGDHLKAQEVILAKIEARVKGIGKAGATDTLAGAYDTLGESITLLFESVSKNSGLLDSFREAINTVSAAIQSWTKTVDAGFGPLKMFGDIIGGVVNAIAWMVKNIHILASAFAALAIVKTITAAYTFFTRKTVEATAATSLFSGALNRIPFVAIASMVIGAVVGWLSYAAAARDARRALEGVNTSNREFLKTQNQIERIALAKNIRETTRAISSYSKELKENEALLATFINLGREADPNTRLIAVSVEKLRFKLKELDSQLLELNKRQIDAIEVNNESTKSTLGQVDALTTYIATYNPASKAVAKFTSDQEILAAGLHGVGGKLVTVERYLAAYTNGVKLTVKEEADLRKEHAKLIADLTAAESMAKLSSPFQKAKEDIDSLIKAQRSASQSAGMGAGIELPFSVNTVEIIREVDKVVSLLDSTSQENIIELGIKLSDGSIASTKKQVGDAVAWMMGETEKLQRISPFTSVLAAADSKLEAISKTSKEDPFGALFNTNAYQKALALNESIKGITNSLTNSGIKEGGELFNRIGDTVKQVAKNRGLQDLIKDDDLKTADGMASAIAKINAAAEKTPASIQAGIGTVGTIMSGIEGVLGQVTAAYGEMAAAAGAAAQAALEHGMSQSQFYMELADTVHYSNNLQAKSFEDKAIAAAEAGAKEYRAQKDAQAKANALAAKSFESQKQMQIAQAIMATSLAVMQTYSNSGLGIYATPLAIAMGALGAAQVASISAQKYTPRAGGGPVNANQPLMVGEAGPELMIPSRSGKIIPNGKLSDALNGGGGGDMQVNITIQATDASSFDQLLVQRRGLLTNMLKESFNSQMRSF
jgi:hypothetical protein